MLLDSCFWIELVREAFQVLKFIFKFIFYSNLF